MGISGIVKINLNAILLDRGNTASLRWKGYIAKCIALGEDYNNFMAQIAVLASICHLDHSQSSTMLHVLIFMHGLSKHGYSNSLHNY